MFVAALFHFSLGKSCSFGWSTAKSLKPQVISLLATSGGLLFFCLFVVVAVVYFIYFFGDF